MKWCPHCKVHVCPPHEACPLCSAALTAAERDGGDAGPPFDAAAYPVYAPAGRRSGLGVKLLLFLCVATGIVCVFINYFSWEYEPTLWSPIVCAVAAALWVMTASLASRTISPGAKLLNFFFAFVGAVLVIDLSLGFDKWSTTYVIPFTTIGLTAVFTLLALRGRGRYREYLGYLLAVFFISLCPILVFVFSLSLLAWTSFVAALYSLITAIGFWIFAERGFRAQMKKMFHL